MDDHRLGITELHPQESLESGETRGLRRFYRGTHRLLEFADDDMPALPLENNLSLHDQFFRDMCCRNDRTVAHDNSSRRSTITTGGHPSCALDSRRRTRCAIRTVSTARERTRSETEKNWSTISFTYDSALRSSELQQPLDGNKRTRERLNSPFGRVIVIFRKIQTV